MPPKQNSKAVAGRAKKAENEAKKEATKAAEKAQQEDDEWSKGAKGKTAKVSKAEKAAAAAAAKAERDRLLAEEEASIAAKPPAAAKKADKKKEPRPAGPGAIAAQKTGKAPEESTEDKEGEIESFAATGLDDALELMSVVAAKTDKASVGTQAGQIERHLEKRVKAAFEAYKERELPKLKEEHPGLRYTQQQEILWKQFQKSPDNPVNQASVAYNATQAERVEVLNKRRGETEERLRVH